MDIRKAIFNMSRKLYLANVPVIPKLLWIFNRIVFSCDTKPSIEMDNSVRLAHSGLGVVMHQKCVIGKNVQIMQNTTFGANRHKRRTLDGVELIAPIVKDNVFIGANTVIMGPIIIGENSEIGAGSVVTKDVPANAIVAGVPAKLIRMKEVNN